MRQYRPARHPWLAGCPVGSVAHFLPHACPAYGYKAEEASGINPVKIGLAVAAERLGRLKPNGQLSGYSPLSQFLELDVLAMGIDGKKQLWTTLRDLAGLGSRLPDIEFNHLIERADQQRAALEPFRARAGTDAFNTASREYQESLSSQIYFRAFMSRS